MRIEIRGIPVAQGRPRFARINGFVRTYDPQKSREWKEAIRLQAIDQGVKPMDGPLTMHADFFLLRPKSLPKKVQAHIKKPDCTNLIKGLEDALRGIAYKDDSQIVKMSIGKHYAGSPGVVVHVEEYGE